MKKRSKKFRKISKEFPKKKNLMYDFTRKVNAKEDWAKFEEYLGKFRNKVVKILNTIQETYSN